MQSVISISNTNVQTVHKIHFHVVSLFPEAFSSYINESIIARAIRDERITITFYNPRDFAELTKVQLNKDKPYARVDDKPYGGGPGMVMEALPLLRAVEKVNENILSRDKADKRNLKSKSKILTIFLSPGGEQFNTSFAKKAATKYTDIIFICGRYEGIDARVSKILKAKLISVGPYVLTGGELPALIMIDSISRQIKGVLGNFDSREEERASSNEVYTRPEVLEWKGKKYKVPKVLLSGNHMHIDTWRSKKNKGII